MPPPGAFDDLCAAAGGGVRAGECRRATGGARALFSTRAHARDDVVFREIPALLVQDPRNVARARACARCHALLDETPTPTACAQGCGVTYCDERCASEHFSSGGHRIACVGPLESYSHPVAALKLACAKDDDGDGLLALLTETVARCVARAEEDAAEEDGREPAGEGGGGFLRRAGAHWFVRGPSSLPAARLESYATLVSDALDAAARDGTCAEDAKRAVLGGDATRAVSELVGLLSRNQLSVVVAANKPAAAAAAPPAAAPSSPSSEPPPAAAYDGVGVFPLVCLMNHSCEPCAEVSFEDAGAGRGGVRAVVRAKRAIAPGDELTHAYVDVDADVSARAAALAGFGFKCVCARCARARGGGRGGEIA